MSENDLSSYLIFSFGYAGKGGKRISTGMVIFSPLFLFDRLPQPMGSDSFAHKGKTITGIIAASHHSLVLPVGYTSRHARSHIIIY